MITMKNVIKEGNPLLHEASIDVNLPLSNEDENILRQMIEYIRESIKEENQNNPEYRPAVGLAAPQLGIMKKMIAIIAPDENYVEHELFLINPKIISYSEELTYLKGGEGCLSVDRPCDAVILRPKRTTFDSYFYDYETREIIKNRLKLKGYLSVVFNHEYDHLKGILFVDKVNKDNPYYVPENATPVIFKGEKIEENEEKS